jgi:hypothetical protein
MSKQLRSIAAPKWRVLLHGLAKPVFIKGGTAAGLRPCQTGLRQLLRVELTTTGKRWLYGTLT